MRDLSMRISMEDRMQQLQNQPNTKGIGENSVQGGRADNRGENSGVMKSGDAIDSGKGGGTVIGGNTLNLHTNNHVMQGGIARNDGINEGGIEGGHSTNFGLNNNELNGGAANNELGSTNHENSFIKGGNAVRELQSGIEKYQGMQKQLSEANQEIIRKNKELLALQDRIQLQQAELKEQQQLLADQSQHSQETQRRLNEAQQLLATNEQEKQQLHSDLAKTKDHVTQLRSDMKEQRTEIEALKKVVDEGKQEIGDLEFKLEQANGDKSKLEERLKNQQERNKKYEEKISQIECKIDAKTKEIASLNSKLQDEDKNRQGLNEKINRLNNDISNLKSILDKKVTKETECSQRVSYLQDKLGKLEAEKQGLADLLQRELESYRDLERQYREFKLSVKTDRETFRELRPMLDQINRLATEGKDILNQPEKSATTITLSASVSSLDANESPMTDKISAGYAQNHGDNSGTIRGGDSVSNSIVVNGLVIENEQVADKLAESMSSLAQSAEMIAKEASDSIQLTAGTVGVFVQTQTPYQVY
ncbi:coiled-coil domain-containing protein, partial [Providencia rustigianii]|uniref:hypothetical protein n=1 Tax=Providencia rustigianii TaxID=158850 RepID=UPI00224095AD